jgi:hypothetical protein
MEAIYWSVAKIVAYRKRGIYDAKESTGRESGGAIG